MLIHAVLAQASLPSTEDRAPRDPDLVAALQGSMEKITQEPGSQTDLGIIDPLSDSMRLAIVQLLITALV